MSLISHDEADRLRGWIACSGISQKELRDGTGLQWTVVERFVRLPHARLQEENARKVREMLRARTGGRSE